MKKMPGLALTSRCLVQTSKTADLAELLRGVGSSSGTGVICLLTGVELG